MRFKFKTYRKTVTFQYIFNLLICNIEQLNSFMNESDLSIFNEKSVLDGRGTLRLSRLIKCISLRAMTRHTTSVRVFVFSPSHMLRRYN